MPAAILCTVLIVLAAFFKAVADTLQHHFGTSVFRYLDPRFWNAEISWQYAHFLKFTRYRLDGWHLANSGMIVSFIGAVAAAPAFPWWVILPVGGLLFNGTFALFYDHILRKT